MVIDVPYWLQSNKLFKGSETILHCDDDLIDNCFRPLWKNLKQSSIQWSDLFKKSQGQNLAKNVLIPCVWFLSFYSRLTLIKLLPGTSSPLYSHTTNWKLFPLLMLTMIWIMLNSSYNDWPLTYLTMTMRRRRILIMMIWSKDWPLGKLWFG